MVPTFIHLKAEIVTAARVRGVSQELIMREIIEWIDFNYHGVVPLPMEASQPEGRGLEE